MKNSATVFAPATTGNVGVGFDVLGVALKSIGDIITVTKTKEVGVITISGLGGTGITTDPKKNTATVGLLKMIEDFKLHLGFEVHIQKGIPQGSGMGGSAASAVAGVVAGNALLKKPLTKINLLKYALIGESIASGSLHGDNVAPCLFGGLVLIQPSEPMNVISIPFPNDLVFVVALPNLQVETKEARLILQPTIPLSDFIKQSAFLSGFIAGCFKKDLKLIASSFKDIIIEPQRAHMISGFYNVKTAAMENGALGCTISGAGPAVFAIATKSKATKVKEAMIGEFEKVGAGPALAWVSSVNKRGAFLK
jgi:homoserine kinase